MDGDDSTDSGDLNGETSNHGVPLIASANGMRDQPSRKQESVTSYNGNGQVRLAVAKGNSEPDDFTSSEEDTAVSRQSFKRSGKKRKIEAVDVDGGQRLSVRGRKNGSVSASSTHSLVNLAGKRPRRSGPLRRRDLRQVRRTVRQIREDGLSEESSPMEDEDPADSDTTPPDADHELPTYVKARVSEFAEQREALGDKGLKLPPDYEGIDFTEDENDSQRLSTRPVMPRNLRPSRSFEDIHMPRSGGVIPAPVAQWLRDYQITGAEFMHEVFVWQRGCILGDDMGLGKTIQVIAFLTAAFGKTGDQRDRNRMRKIRKSKPAKWYPRILLVCPGVLMENWSSELRKWGWWSVDQFHGSNAGKRETLQAAKSGRLEIMITTYTTYRLNKSLINTVDWDAVVADECHAIKEPSAEITQAMNEVNALCRIGLSGTAVQNKYDEFWTLLNWANPGKFGSRPLWRKTVSAPLKLGQSHDATVAQLMTARKTAEALVFNLLPQYFLRRTKKLIAEQLPKKSDRVIFCPLTDVQAEAYQTFVNGEIADFIRRTGDMCDCGSGKKRGWCCYEQIPGRGLWQCYSMACLVTLQKMANHVALLIPQGSDMAEKQEKDLEVLQIALPDRWREIYRQKDSILHHASQEFCGKWKVLKRLLQFWHTNGDKVLVFSHSVRLLKMLHLLFSSTTSYNVSYFDGSMSYEERAHVVKDFNNDDGQFVFLISTRAGGVGLNITSANKVVIVDPNWNPAYDLQAQDRAYRIGQTRDVEVFRLISAGTIEEIVYARQIYKQQQSAIAYNASHERRYFSGVQDQSDKRGEIFGLKNLLSFRSSGVVLRDIVNKTNIAESKAGFNIIGIDNLEESQDSNLLSQGISSGDDGERLIAEDAAISQLAAQISAGADMNNPSEDGDTTARPRHRGRKAKSTGASANNIPNPIDAILARAGVDYTHENSEVIGSSKIEAKLSKRAMQYDEPEGMKIQFFSDGHSGPSPIDDPSVEEQVSDDLNTKPAVKLETDKPDKNSPGSNDGTDKSWVSLPIARPKATAATQPGLKDTVLPPLQLQSRYRPPLSVRRQHFCSIARFCGFDTAEDLPSFALLVESWNTEQRRECLEDFYRARRKTLATAQAQAEAEDEAPAEVGEWSDRDGYTVKKEEFSEEL